MIGFAMQKTDGYADIRPLSYQPDVKLNKSVGESK